MKFNDWKYLIILSIGIVCVCFSISYGLNKIDKSVRGINSELRLGIDSVKGMQVERNIQAGGYYDSISTKLDRIERKVSK